MPSINNQYYRGISLLILALRQQLENSPVWVFFSCKILCFTMFEYCIHLLEIKRLYYILFVLIGNCGYIFFINCIIFNCLWVLKSLNLKICRKNSIRVFLLELGKRIEKNKVLPGTFKNHIDYMTPQKYVFQISNQ